MVYKCPLLLSQRVFLFNMIEDLKKWLSDPCKESDVRYLEPENKKEEDRAAYIPIGIIENTLDEFDSWDTYDFKGLIYKASNYWFYDASVILEVTHSGIKIRKSGAVTFPISSQDTNMDFSATALSYCIANAAKKLGKKFGRHLNGRLNKGETGLPIIKIQKKFEPETINAEYEELVLKLNDFEFKEEAEEFLNTTSFKWYLPAKTLVNSKPNKI